MEFTQLQESQQQFVSTTTLGGTVITKAPHLSSFSLSDLSTCAKWVQFIEQFDKPDCPIFLKSFLIRDIYMFGRNIGFIVGEGEAYYKGTSKEAFSTFVGPAFSIPAYIFIRGDAASVFVAVQSAGQTFLLFVQQIRFSMGGFVYETIAGMMDENGDFRGVAMKEAIEEAGICISSPDELVDLGVICPSVGGTLEKIRLFFYSCDIDADTMERMKSKVYGNAEEKEKIQIVFVPLVEYLDKHARFDDMFDQDVKISCSFDRASRRGLI
jgi:ADP-sugar diphosphatase